MKKLLILMLVLTLFPLGKDTRANPIEPELDPLSHKLTQAYEIRSKNRELFAKYLKELNHKKGSLSASEKNHLEYLNAYQAAFTGNINLAIEKSENLISNPAASFDIKFESRLLLINIAAVAKNWAGGLKQLTPLLVELENIENEALYNKAVGVMAIFYNVLGQYEQGLYYAEKHKEATFGSREHCTISSFKIEASLKLNRFNSEMIKNAILSCETINEHIVTSSIKVYLAEYYIKNKKPQDAINELLPLVSSAKYTAYPRVTFEMYVTIAQAYWELGQIAPANFYASKSIDYMADLETSEPTVNAYELLYKIAKHNGNHLLALSYHEKYVKADKAFLNQVSAKTSAVELAQQDAIQREAEIKMLNKQNELLKAEQTIAQTRSNNYKLLAGLLVMLLLVMTYIARHAIKKQTRLRELAEYDNLTGIYNRGHFTHAAQSAIHYCENTEQSLSVIIFDLDDFKKVNDRFGHATGDWALVKAATVIKEIGRKNDVFARIGGEEFAMVLIGCNINEAAEIAEHCRGALEKIDTSDSGYQFKVTASFGVTDMLSSGMMLEKLMADADAASYKSKHAGRNRVTVFGQEPTEPNDLDEQRDPVSSTG